MTAIIQDPRTILCFGDSNTWGFNPDGSGRFPQPTRWPNQLERALNQTRPDLPWRTVEEGLNSRTWLHDDAIGTANYGGDYSCSGRSGLMTALHSHKPIDVVILALGCNDCKGYLNLSAQQITAGARILIHDTRRALNCGPRLDTPSSPQIILMTPPAIRITPQSLTWGFEGAELKSQALAEHYRRLAVELDVACFDVQPVANPSTLDGVHFDAQSQALIAAGLAACIRQTLGQHTSADS